MGKFQDLTGQTFGYWTVIEKDSSLKSKQTYWICKCKCGKIKSVRADVLKRNNQSCGCATKERMKNQTMDLTRQRFGMLIVLNQVKREDVKTKDSFWLCHCDCGNICTVQASNLKSGATKSCGCNHKSFGEQKIAQLLNGNSIPFEIEKTFSSCRFAETNYFARFDFYVNNQYLIEFDGKQHFTSDGWDGEIGLQRNQEHDAYKNQWCKDNNIPLIRIPYTHYEDLCLEDLLLEISKFII